MPVRPVALKLAPQLRTQLKSFRKKDVHILVSSREKFQEAINSFPESFSFCHIQDQIYLVKGVDTRGLNALLAEACVLFIDVASRSAKEERVMDFSDLSVNNVVQAHIKYQEITGEGLTLSIKEALFDTTDVDFNQRIVNLERADEKLSFHATAMATLAAGAGNSDPKGKGVAWKAWINSSSFDNLLPDDTEWLKSIQVSVQNHSYGTGIENYYGIEAQQYDKQSIAYPEILHVFSTGNAGLEVSEHSIYKGVNGFANLTGQFKMSKNILTVGELSLQNQVKTQSSKGPAFDGRVKPELVAFGDQGSSESAALVSGICILLQDVYKQQTKRLPSAELLKAVLLNSAEDVGRPEVDFEAGYGSVDALGAIETIKDKRFVRGLVKADEVVKHSLSLPENVGRLKITLVWHDMEGFVNCNKALVNDLDLIVKKSSTGEEWKPWVLNHYPHIDSLRLPAKRESDHLNNIEQVTINSPDQGNYEIQVIGYHIPADEQSYSIAWEYEPNGFTWEFPGKGMAIEGGKPVRLSWVWNGDQRNGNLQYQNCREENWVSLDSHVNLSSEFYEWLPPEEAQNVKFRMETNKEVWETDTLTITPTMQIQTGLNCGDELMLYWSPQKDINSYQIFQVHDKYMRPYKMVADTAVFILGDDLKDLYYAVAPVVDGHMGVRGRSMNYKVSGTGCYIRSFYPLSQVTDTVQLQFELATDYKLSSIALERESNGLVKTVREIQKLETLRYVIEDNDPQRRTNTYRLRLNRDDDKIIYSDWVNVFYSIAGSVWLYPNPVQSGQEVNIINGEEGADQINIYSVNGQLMRRYLSDYGMVKSFSTEVLERGFYIIEIITEMGYEHTCKLIIR